MNAARLARLLEEAGDDRRRWAEAICDEITDPTTGLVTRDHLDRRFAEFETRFAGFETKFAQFRGEQEERFAAFRVEFETKFAELRGDFSAFKAEMATFKADMTRLLVYTQVGGFVAIALLILLRL